MSLWIYGRLLGSPAVSKAEALKALPLQGLPPPLSPRLSSQDVGSLETGSKSPQLGGAGTASPARKMWPYKALLRGGVAESTWILSCCQAWCSVSWEGNPVAVTLKGKGNPRWRLASRLSLVELGYGVWESWEWQSRACNPWSDPVVSPVFPAGWTFNWSGNLKLWSPPTWVVSVAEPPGAVVSVNSRCEPWVWWDWFFSIWNYRLFGAFRTLLFFPDSLKVDEKC